MRFARAPVVLYVVYCVVRKREEVDGHGKDLLRWSRSQTTPRAAHPPFFLNIRRRRRRTPIGQPKQQNIWMRSTHKHWLLAWEGDVESYCYPLVGSRTLHMMLVSTSSRTSSTPFVLLRFVSFRFWKKAAQKNTIVLRSTSKESQNNKKNKNSSSNNNKKGCSVVQQRSLPPP